MLVYLARRKGGTIFNFLCAGMGRERRENFFQGRSGCEGTLNKSRGSTHVEVGPRYLMADGSSLDVFNAD
jgi:hypothetical protein